MDQTIFETDRPLLFSIAYRMLGSAADAEDVVHDAFLRFLSADRSAIRSPKAFATTVVTRLCLDRLKSCRTQREQYVGPWLPEPVLTSELNGPDAMMQHAESLTFAFLVLLEALSPEERAVFLLKDVFDYDHSDIATMLGTTVANSRQLLHRAKRRLASERPRPSGTTATRRALAERFARAMSAGDKGALTDLLAADVGICSDGGGKAVAARRPIVNRGPVIDFLIGVRRAVANAGALDQVSMAVVDVNCESALVVRIRGRLESIFVFSIERDTISTIRIVRNPEKLARLDRRLGTRH